ncbi:MAG: ribosomal-processing cysteine protease Prp [Bacilli bacterium]|nr:ribosomal-processing cysteine protease Prp [Bacilli bacterium]
MTKVRIVFKGKDLASLTIKGHAGAGAYGHDLVCAATSAVTFGALNAIEDIDNDFDYEIDQEEGYVSLTPKGAISEHDSVVLETLILQLKTIEASYPSAIEITERK